MRLQSTRQQVKIYVSVFWGVLGGRNRGDNVKMDALSYNIKLRSINPRLLLKLLEECQWRRLKSEARDKSFHQTIDLNNNGKISQTWLKLAMNSVQFGMSWKNWLSRCWVSRWRNLRAANNHPSHRSKYENTTNFSIANIVQAKRKWKQRHLFGFSSEEKHQSAERANIFQPLSIHFKRFLCLPRVTHRMHNSDDL